MNDPVSLGFVGLGSMGGPMCRRLAQAGYAVHAFDLDAAKLAETVEAGAVAAGSVAAAAAAADIFLTSLPRPDHVEAVMLDGGALAALRPGAVWVDLTTNRIELVADLADRAPQGVRVVDSPVTDAVDGARTGRLTLFVGGDPDAVETVVPVLSELGTVITADLPLTAAARGVFTRAGRRYGSAAPELTVAKLIEEDADLSFRLDGEWVAPWEVDE